MSLKSKMHKIIINSVSNKKRADLYKKWGGISIGNNCEVYKNVSFGSEPYLISIGDNVRITSGVKFCTHDGGMWVVRNLEYNKTADLFGRIRIGNNVHIGWNSIIMPNVNIGSNVIIGIGSVVTHDIPSNSVAVGVPARVIRSINEYYEKNKMQIVDTKGMSSEEKLVFLKNKFDLK